MPPTDYFGDPTAAQSPDVAPEPESVPQIRLPNAGEGATAASIRQELKNLADRSAWSFAPRAKASDWGAPILQYRNALLQVKSGVDQHGFPAGRIHTVHEDWTGFPLSGYQGTATGTVGPWSWQIVDSGLQLNKISARAPALTASTPFGPSLVMSVVQTATNDLAQVWRTIPLVAMSADLVTIVDFSVMVTGLTAQAFLAGFALTPVTGTPIGGYLRKTPSDTNWMGVTKSAAGGILASDTSVAPGTTSFHRCRIVLLGATSSDDSSSRVLFFIDGLTTPAVNVASPVPFEDAGAALTLVFGTWVTTPGVNTFEMIVSPITYRCGQIAGGGLF